MSLPPKGSVLDIVDAQIKPRRSTAAVAASSPGGQAGQATTVSVGLDGMGIWALGHPNSFQIASLERILLAIKEKEQIASD
jgi:hypothetical protein